MKNRSTIITIAVVVVLILGYWVWRRASLAPGQTDLVSTLSSAETRPAGKAFPVVDQEIGGETLRAISAEPPSRIIWKMQVPRDAWLKTSLGVKPEAWDKEGNGVLFRIGVSDGKSYEELLNQHVDPKSSQGDRRWIPVNLDLSAYSEMDVELIFNTNSGPPNQKDDPTNDFAVWGAPQVYVR